MFERDIPDKQEFRGNLEFTDTKEIIPMDEISFGKISE
jgi:hypothetical protein